MIFPWCSGFSIFPFHSQRSYLTPPGGHPRALRFDGARSAHRRSTEPGPEGLRQGVTCRVVFAGKWWFPMGFESDLVGTPWENDEDVKSGKYDTVISLQKWCVVVVWYILLGRSWDSTKKGGKIIQDTTYSNWIEPTKTGLKHQEKSSFNEIYLVASWEYNQELRGYNGI